MDVLLREPAREVAAAGRRGHGAREREPRMRERERRRRGGGAPPRCQLARARRAPPLLRNASSDSSTAAASARCDESWRAENVGECDSSHGQRVATSGVRPGGPRLRPDRDRHGCLREKLCCRFHDRRPASGFVPAAAGGSSLLARAAGGDAIERRRNGASSATCSAARRRRSRSCFGASGRARTGRVPRGPRRGGRGGHRAGGLPRRDPGDRPLRPPPPVRPMDAPGSW